MGRTSDARERLIQSGRELMHERGYTAVGVAELCERAGVKKGSFYYLFPSKQDLTLEVIESLWADSSEPFEELTGGEAPPLERLQNFLDSSYRHHCETREQSGRLLGCVFGNLALEMSTQDAVVRESLARIFDAQIDAFAALIDEAMERGDLPACDSREAAQALLSLLEGAVMLAKTHDNTEDLEGLYRQALRLLGASAAA